MPDIFISSKKDENKDSETEKTSVLKKNKTIKPKELKKPHFVGVTRSSAYKGIRSMQTKRPLSSFLFFPHGINFETREEEEKVVLFLRRHIITNIPWILLSIVMLFVPTFISSIKILDNVPSNFRFIFILMWYLFTLIYTLENFLTWFFNVYIVTDERIIDIDFYNLIYKEVSDANIDKIQDVTYKMGGVARTLFNFGDVIIQTASELPNFDFSAVPKPDMVAKILQDLRMEEQQEFLEGRVR